MISQQQEDLVLIVDDEIAISRMISQYFHTRGLSSVIATDGEEGLTLFREKKPKLVITDIQMPKMKGLEFLKEVRTFDTTTPIIIITGFPDMNTAIEAIHNGAYDYVVKPFQMEVLYSKVVQALNTVNLTRENVALSKLVSLHDIANKLANTHAVSEILDVTFQFCLEVIKADRGSILLVNKAEKQLEVVRAQGDHPGPDVSKLKDKKEWPISKWVTKHTHSLAVIKGVPNRKVSVPLSVDIHDSIISVPLKAAEEMIGVVNLLRKGGEPFSEVDLNMVEVLASQAGTAVSNADLYTSLNQKLSELSLISNYSDHFVGLVDLTEVIRCLFETVRKSFPIDVMGILIVKKRFHEFLYWSRGEISATWVAQITENTIAEFNHASNLSIMKKRVKSLFLEIAPPDGSTLKTPLAFNHIIPLVWEGFNFGALYFGAEETPQNKDESVSLLTSLVSQTRVALTSAMLYNQMKENYIRTIKALAIAVDAKDTYTHGHSENVMNIAAAIATEMQVDAESIGIIRDGGLLHDIGKIGIPGDILNKPGPLTREEFDGVMKTHSTLGANIVKEVPFLKELHSLILHHHEHYDGTGYPDGLSGDEIPVGVRILHVADAFEAMTSNRPYRDSLGKNEAMKRLQENKGKEFDPDVVDAFSQMAEKKGWLKKKD